MGPPLYMLSVTHWKVLICGVWLYNALSFTNIILFCMCCWILLLVITYQQHLSNPECMMPLKNNTVAKALVTIHLHLHIWYSWRNSSQPLIELEVCPLFQLWYYQFWLLCNKRCTVTLLNCFRYHYLNKMAVWHGYWRDITHKYSATQCKKITRKLIQELSHYSSIMKLKTVSH